MPESIMYKPVEDMFFKEGYFSISARKKLSGERVHSSFGVSVHGVTKKIDVVAFKSIDSEVEAKAVECKYGETWEAAGQALGQATAYQRIFPEVYVASQASEENLKHVESLLRELGLGYICVKNGKAEEVFPPGHNIRFNRKEFDLQVKGKAIALLALREALGSNFQFGRADVPSYVWVSSLEPGNLTCSILEPYGEGSFWFALNIERKREINKIFSKVKVKKLCKLLSSLPSNYKLWIGKFASYRPKKYVQEEERSVSQLKLHDIESYLNKMRKWNWAAHIQIGKEVHFDVLSKSTFASELEKAMTELSPLKDLFNSLV